MLMWERRSGLPWNAKPGHRAKPLEGTATEDAGNELTK